MKINAKGQSSSFCCFPSSSSCSPALPSALHTLCGSLTTAAQQAEKYSRRQRDRLRQRRERGQVLLSRGYLWVQGSSCLYSSSSFSYFSFSLAGRLLWLLLFNIEPDAESDRPPLYVLLLFFCTLQHTQHKVVACHNDRVLVLDSCFSPSLSLCLSLLFCFAFQCAIICFCRDRTTLCRVLPWYCLGDLLCAQLFKFVLRFSHCQSSAVSAVSEKRLLRSFSRCT